MVKVGDKITTWFSDQPDGQSRVTYIRPYYGKFTEHFNCVLELTAPRTRAGTVEMTYYDEDYHEHPTSL